jgi:hypothetical protein
MAKGLFIFFKHGHWPFVALAPIDNGPSIHTHIQSPIKFALNSGGSPIVQNLHKA